MAEELKNGENGSGVESGSSAGIVGAGKPGTGGVATGDGDGGTGSGDRGVGGGNETDGTSTGKIPGTSADGGTTRKIGNGDPAVSGVASVGKRVGRPPGVKSAGSGGSRRSSGDAPGTEEETQRKIPNVVKISVPKPVSFKDAEETKKRQTKKTSVDADTIAYLLALVFFMVSLSKHPFLRSAWDYSPEDLRKVSDPLTRILNKYLPVKHVDNLDKLVDPVLLIVAFAGIIDDSMKREAVLKIELTRLVKQNEAGRSGVTNSKNDSSAGNSTGNFARNGKQGDPSNPIDSRPTNLPL